MQNAALKSLLLKIKKMVLVSSAVYPVAVIVVSKLKLVMFVMLDETVKVSVTCCTVPALRGWFA
jgi:hypothetical protein